MEMEGEMEGAVDRLAVRRAAITLQLHRALVNSRDGCNTLHVRSNLEPHSPLLIFILHNLSVFHSYYLNG